MVSLGELRRERDTDAHGANCMYVIRASRLTLLRSPKNFLIKNREAVKFQMRWLQTRSRPLRYFR